MSHIELRYGRGAVGFEFEAGRFEVLEPDPGGGGRPLSDAEVGAAIDDPVDSPPLEDIISPGESVLVVVSDATRQTASAQVVNRALDLGNVVGVTSGNVAVYRNGSVVSGTFTKARGDTMQVRITHTYTTLGGYVLREDWPHLPFNSLSIVVHTQMRSEG